jgi:hypothetical protein
VFRYDELLSFKVRLAEPPEDTCWLQFDETLSEEIEQRQSAWLRQ